MKEYGGYLPLELSQSGELYQSSLRLNSGRNCLHLLLNTNDYKRIFLPHYICHSLVDTIKKTDVELVSYSINSSLEPIFDYEDLTDSDVFLFPNYFSLKSNFIVELAKIKANFIIDNAQSFFSKPQKGIDCFYSPRKFFGVSDGGYLVTKNKKSRVAYEVLSKDYSSKRYSHLLGRHDNSAKIFFKDYTVNETKIEVLPQAKMSELTRKILSSIDYESIKKKRFENFKFLHNHFLTENELSSIIDLRTLDGPMTYPLLIANKGLKEKLINKNIYIPTYWDYVDSSMDLSFESYLKSNLICLPVDQRYSVDDMNIIINTFEGLR